MLNKILFSIVIISLFTLSTVSSVLAIDFEVGVEEEEEIIWKCNVCNEEKLEVLFGEDWNSPGTGVFENLKQNSKMKWKITEIDNSAELYSEKTDNNEKAISITFDVWTWTSENEWGEKDFENQISLYKDPANNQDDMVFPNFAPFWLPVPIGEYMKALEPNLFERYTVDGRVLLAITYELDEGDLDDKYPSEYIKVLAMYNGRGLLRSYKLYIINHHVIIDISLASTPLYELPFIIILVILSYIGLVYVMLKID